MGWWWGGYVTQTPLPTTTTPSNFLLRCHAVKMFLGHSVLCKVSEYLSSFAFDGPLWHKLGFCDFRFKYLANFYYVGTTDILCSTFSFESVNMFSHFYRSLPTPPHPWHLSYVYDIVTFKFECQGWGGGGGYVTQTPLPTTTTPSNFLLRCHAVKMFLGHSVLCKVSEYISFFCILMAHCDTSWVFVILGLNT